MNYASRNDSGPSDHHHNHHNAALHMGEDKESYLRRRAIELQKSLVNVKTTQTSTVESCIWTYRTTSCDVISLITTTVPLKNGAMGDLRYVNKELKRCTRSKCHHRHLHRHDHLSSVLPSHPMRWPLSSFRPLILPTSHTYHRIKAPIAKPGTFLATHPLLNKLIDAEATSRRRKNDSLKMEKKTFMSKLQT